MIRFSKIGWPVLLRKLHMDKISRKSTSKSSSSPVVHTSSVSKELLTLAMIKIASLRLHFNSRVVYVDKNDEGSFHMDFHRFFFLNFSSKLISTFETEIEIRMMLAQRLLRGLFDSTILLLFCCRGQQLLVADEKSKYILKWRRL